MTSLQDVVKHCKAKIELNKAWIKANECIYDFEIYAEIKISQERIRVYEGIINLIEEE